MEDVTEMWKEQEKKYEKLKGSPYFVQMDEEEEYDKRLLYQYTKEDDDFLYEATIYIPIQKGLEYDWEFHTYRKIGNMAVLSKKARSLPETSEWFQEIAKPVDQLVRLRKLTKT